MTVFTAPEMIQKTENPSIFLAGTIDMGESRNWQGQFIELLNRWKVDVYNPRREEWVSSWVQEYSNPHFFQQVTWELDALEKATFIVFNFLGNSKSPVTMMELGLFAHTGKCHVVCPPEFWRRGNIEMVCSRYNIPLHTSESEFFPQIPKIFNLK